MADDKKPLRELLKGGPPLVKSRQRIIGGPSEAKPQQPHPVNPTPQAQAEPQIEECVELPSEDIDLTEITIPPKPKLNLQISSNIMHLFRELAEKDVSLAEFQGEPPDVDKNNNIVIKGKIFGKLASDSEARIYFDKVWEKNSKSKLTLFTNSPIFISACMGNCIYFSVGPKIRSLSCAKDENSPAVMSV